MATNEILPFATDDTGTNLLTQAEYSTDAQRDIGHQPGIARSKLTNKTMRQTSLLAAGLAEFIADYQANNVNDDLTPQQIADYLEQAITAAFPQSSATVQGKVELATNAEVSTGTDTQRAVTPAGAASHYAIRTRNIAAGNGLTGGGDLTADRTFSVDSTVVRTSRNIATGDGLNGGGNLTTNRTFSVDTTVVRTSRNIAAGSGLTGGGNLTTNRTLSLGTPTTLSGNTTNNVGSSTHTHAIAASTTALRGVIELATSGEALAGSDSQRAISPATLNSVINSLTKPLGVGQSWQNVSRTFNVTYTNTTGRPIAVLINMEGISASGSLFIDGLQISFIKINGALDPLNRLAHYGVVPAGSTYRLAKGSFDTLRWHELR